MDKDKIYVEEIKEFSAKIVEFMAGVNFEQFVQDQKLNLAIVKLIENIGEASKRLSEETKGQYPKVDWKKSMAMRDKLVHDYMEVDLAIVYDVAMNEVPALLRNLQN
ncbi:MAG: hypothetical protein A3H72_00345 [Candidatus Doudnabacteria bacterium RIFCSPLOWO2_02_FULL_48_8]|uniref:DUF86 domain-containing protein n=1 Tax=Candidatus Doudnabacteria bacterium RIFCSPHIGHO2_01_FULL_46_24 TaxID=1817825 RepID=A0A1F5NW39_9BACT|nr:MAG: hypothetical protein A2720_03575 [Candidatus Doudnabacteria bacterium RIFCSPHIGHO2_01_FULL_46_24]OGE95315.1 MAG: hypothetical protein A3H72_00345 [Candidatus Doudnabacteria bacterium RIFCSPLOWO2_02_FULL_48_8]OGE95619.1 MAG: hypothetical protein A3E98_01310 [Candidatus Doudnabacteria bacterium RIFCSPHIGHO2_12_FULL_48_11]